MTIARSPLSPRASAGRKRRAERRGDAPRPRRSAKNERAARSATSHPTFPPRRRRSSSAEADDPTPPTSSRRDPRAPPRRSPLPLPPSRRRRRLWWPRAWASVVSSASVAHSNSDGKEERVASASPRPPSRRPTRDALPPSRRAFEPPRSRPSTSPGCRRRVLDREPRAPSRPRTTSRGGSRARLARGVSPYPPPTPEILPARKTDTPPRRDTPRLFEARVPRAPRSRRTLSPPTRHR